LLIITINFLWYGASYFGRQVTFKYIVPSIMECRVFHKRSSTETAERRRSNLTKARLFNKHHQF